MLLKVQTMGDVALVDIWEEEMDAGNAPDFKNAIAPVLEANAKVLLDFSRVRFIDSSGLGFVLSCLRNLRARGGTLKLCGLSKQVRAVFELVRMNRILDIHDTRAEAAESFQDATRTAHARDSTT